MPQLDFVMSYTRKKAEQIVTGLERPLNRHLIKLIGLRAPDETRAVWKKEVKRWLRELSVLRLKPDGRPLKAQDFREWLYAEPFEGAEVELVHGVLTFEGEDFAIIADAASVAAAMKALHEQLCARLATGDTAEDLIDAL